ncbi:hypothetical protein GOZ65_23585 [Vibrio parahaemolyticus]|nr:hypothetical protein [Vibrio parahaemolyticus]
MTKIIIKKRKTLSLKRPEPEETKEPELTPKELAELRVIEAKKEGDRQYRACRDWIFSTWPELFDRNNIRPLAKGTLQSIKAEYVAQGGFESLGFHGNSPLKKVLSGWTKRKAYQKALAEEGAYRYHLLGEAVEPVSEIDQQHAAERLEKIRQANARNRKKKKSED